MSLDISKGRLLLFVSVVALMAVALLPLYIALGQEVNPELL